MDAVEVLYKALEVDPEGGAFLIDLVVYDMAMEELASIAPELDAAFIDYGVERIAKAKQALGRSYVGKAVDGEYPDQHFQQTADWLVGIESWLIAKAEAWETWNRGGEQEKRRVLRDEGGRFSRFTQALSGQGRGIRQFARQDQPGESRTQAALGRIGIAGQVVGALSPELKAAQMARYVGAYGPEAARVLDPHVRRAAYRYRGTERTPDADLVGDLSRSQNDHLESAADAVDGGSPISEIALNIYDPGEKSGQDNTPVLQSLKYRAMNYPDATGDSLRLGVRSDTAAMHLISRMPRETITGRISAEAGTGLPSEGVMINKDGEVISQSVGFSDDHYLPFNLANMSRMRGGQYVRTRRGGGHTGEDIYATVASGARSATVASSSGVFRIEMAPDFRGARAMSDKAASMHSRYLNILQAIDAGGLYTKGLGQAGEQKISDQASSEGLAVGSEAHTQRTRILRNEALAEKANITTEERANIAAKAAQDLGPQATRQDVEDHYYELLSAERANRGQEIELNADGYHLALKTLQRQFPYFIRSVEYQPLRGEADNARGPNGQTIMTPRRRDMGFLSSRGAKVPVGLVSRPLAKDPNFRRRPVTPSTAATPSTTQQAPPTPPGGGQRPPAPQGGPQGGPQAPQAPAPGPQQPSGSPAAQRAGMRAQLGAQQVSRMSADFTRGMGAILNPQGAPGPVMGLYSVNPKEPFANFSSYPREDQVAWLLMQDNSADISNAIRANPQQSLDALSADPETIKIVLRNLYNAGDPTQQASPFDDWVADNKFFGAADSDELATEISRRATLLLDAQLMQQPITSAGASEFDTSAQAIDYPEITGVSNMTQLGELMARRPELVRMAQELTVTETGESVPISDTAARMEVLRTGYSQLRDARQQLAGNSAMRLTTPPAQAIRDMGLSKEFLATSGLGVDDVGRMLNLQGAANHNPNEISQHMRLWQQARTLAEVARTFDALDQLGGGGQNPKAPLLVRAADRLGWGPPQNPPPVRKALLPRPQGFSSLRVLSPNDPVSKAVALRRANGSPFVPRRITR